MMQHSSFSVYLLFSMSAIGSISLFDIFPIFIAYGQYIVVEIYNI